MRSSDWSSDVCSSDLKLIDRFAQPLAIPGNHIVSRHSVGVTLYPLDESDGESLLRHADMAMYQAKQDGRGCYRIFTTEIAADRRRRLALDREIHAAVALTQFHLLLAPILALKDRKRTRLNSSH